MKEEKKETRQKRGRKSKVIESRIEQKMIEGEEENKKGRKRRKTEQKK